MNAALALALALGWLTVTAPGQATADQSLRSKAYGEVRDLDGKPWVGARIVLVHALGGSEIDTGIVDRLETKTDRRGRFRVPVLLGRAYSAWAISPAKDESLFRTTAVEEGVIAGVPVLMTESKKRTRGRQIQFSGLDRWRHRRPFRARCVTVADNPLASPVLLDAEFRAMTPALPGHMIKVQLFDKGGVKLIEQALTIGGKIRVPAPRTCLVGVRNIDTGKGIARAEVLMRMGGRMVTVGVTGADGVAEVILPSRSSIRHNDMFVRAAGFATAPTLGGVCKQVKEKKWPPHRPGTVVERHATLGSGLSFKGRVLLGKDRPARNLTLLLRGRGMHFNEKKARRVADYIDVVRTDDAGRFEVRGCLKESSFQSRLDLILGSEHILQFPKQWHRTLHHRVSDVANLSEGGFGQINDLGDLNLGEFLPVEITIKEPSGVPASGARVGLASLGGDSISRGPGAEKRVADRAGRISLLLRPQREVVLIVSHVRGSRACVLEASPRAGHRRYALSVRLRAPVEIGGRVVDTDGKPVVGMALRRRYNWRSRVVPMPIGAVGGLDVDDDQADDDQAAADATEVQLRALSAQQMLGILRSGEQYPTNVKTDEAGRFVFRVPAYSSSYRIYGNRTRLGVFRQKVDQIVEIEDGSVTDLEIEIQ